MNNSETNNLQVKSPIQALYDVMEANRLSYSNEVSADISNRISKLNTAFNVQREKGNERHPELCGHFLWDNGQQSQYLCQNAQEKGVLFGELEDIKKDFPEIQKMVLECESSVKQNDAGKLIRDQLKQTIILYIPTLMCIKREYVLDVILSEPEKSAALKIFVLMAPNSRGIVTINFRSRQEAAETFCTGQVFVNVQEGAELWLNEIQDLNQAACSFMWKRSVVEKDAILHWNICEMGALRSTSDMQVDLIGEGANVNVYGLYFPTKTQRLNLFTYQNHIVPGTVSNLLYKGAINDSASASWEGMIYVSPEAVRTDGYQKDENLLLSKDARVYSKPGLEIVTDDVKCSHGTTITDIDPDQIFYLESRGLSEKEAKKLIIQGYFDTVLNLISYEPIRSKLQEKIVQKMDEGV